MKFSHSESEMTLAADTAAAWLPVALMKKDTGCRSVPLRQVLRRHVMEREPPVLSADWQMVMKQPDKRQGKQRRDL